MTDAATPLSLVGPRYAADVETLPDVLELLLSHVVVQAVAAAVRYGLFEHVSEGSRTLAELAKSTGLPLATVTGLVRVLSDRHLIELQGNRAALAPRGRHLLRETALSLAPAALLAAAPFRWRAWEAAAESLTSDRSAFRAAHGVGLLEHLARSPTDRQLYGAWVEQQDRIHAAVLGDAIRLRAGVHVVDVGGGYGHLIRVLLERYPTATGVVFDKPAVIEAARARMAVDRCDYVAGDFFSTVPGGADVYILKLVLHDWSDEMARQILEGVRARSTPAARLLVIEAVVGRRHSAVVNLANLNMSAMTAGGRERSVDEWRALLSSAGFELSEIVDTPLPLCLLMAHAA